jgi:hypothetical protein
VDEAAAAVQIARIDLVSTVEMDLASFDKLVGPIEKKQAGSWRPARRQQPYRPA